MAYIFTSSDRGMVDEITQALEFLGNEKCITYQKEIDWLHSLEKKFDDQPCLPSTLNDAAEEYRKNLHRTGEDVDDEGYMWESTPSNAFIAGAKWMAQQGVSIDTESRKYQCDPKQNGKIWWALLHFQIDSFKFPELEKLNLKDAEDIIVQIRRK